jgi:ribose transport system substrate-binding protein
MISPFSDALAPIVEQAMEQGIPVVTMDRRVPTEVAVHVGAENLPIGRQAGEFLVEQNTDARCIEVQGGAANSAALGRHDGFAEGIAGSNVEIVATTNVEDWGREGSVAFVEDQLQRFGSGEIDCVYAHNDEMALGAALAIEDAGRSGEFVIIGVDGQNSAIQAVADGTLGATFVYPFVAPEGVITAYEVSTGTYTGDAEYVLPGAAIFADNVDEWIGKGFG